MSSVSLEDVKIIDELTHNLIYGYSRRIEALFPYYNTYYTIPTLIIHWIMLYYFEREYFKTFNNAKYEHIGDQNTKIKGLRKSNEGSVYGAIIMKPNKKITLEYEFKILSKTNYDVLIGIDDEQEIDKIFCWKTNSSNYGYSSNRLRWIKDQSENYGERYSNGDTIKMIIDLNQMSICWSKNGIKYEETSINQTSVGYRMAIRCGPDAVIELVSYSLKY